MTISFGQIILILIVAILLFGNFSNILKEIAQGIKNVLSSSFEETMFLKAKKEYSWEKQESLILEIFE